MIIFVMSLGFLTPSQSAAREMSPGVGVILGIPTGLAAQLPLTTETVLNGSLYYDLRDADLSFHIDQIWLEQKSSMLSSLFLYYGWGGRFFFTGGKNRKSGVIAVARLPLGVEYGTGELRGFVEIAPALEVIPSIAFHLHGALGIRIHF